MLGLCVCFVGLCILLCFGFEGFRACRVWELGFRGL